MESGWVVGISPCCPGVTTTLTYIRRNIRTFNIAGGAVLIAVGLLMVTGIWMQWIYQIQSLAGTFITPV